MLALNCLVLGETQQHIFTVKIDAAESVGTLKEFIKEEKKPVLDHIPADALMLWKVSTPYDGIKDLAGLPDGEALMPLTTLSVIFPNHEVGGNIDIIIKLPPTTAVANVVSGGMFGVVVTAGLDLIL